MNKYIEITADTNDGDYVSQRSKITDAQIEALKPVIKAIKAVGGHHNWETGEMIEGRSPKELYLDTNILSKHEVDLFYEFVPCGEYGIHTIESVKILVVSEEISLL